MKKSELQSGMIIQTTHNRYGFVELDRNRINICYDPDVLKDEYAHLEMVSLDDVFEYDDGKLGIGTIVTQEMKDKYPTVYDCFEVGGLCIYYDIVAVYTSKRIYYDGVGAYPPLIINENEEEIEVECDDVK